MFKPNNNINFSLNSKVSDSPSFISASNGKSFLCLHPVYFERLLSKSSKSSPCGVASGAFDETERQTAITRMNQAGVIVADYNAIVVEMLENNADPLAAQVYAAIGQSHFVSMRDIYSTITTSKIVPPVRGTQ